MIIIAILNQKGGTGKTTLTVHIARCLQLMGYKTLVVDTDPQANALTWHAASEGRILPVFGITGSTIKKDIGNISEDYHFVVIDGAGHLDDNRPTIAALLCADVLLMPIKPSPFDKWSTPDMFPLIEQAQLIRQEKEQAALKFSLVLNECKTNTLSMRNTEAECRKRNLPLFNARTFDREDYINCIENGLTALDTSPAGKASQEIKAITNELLEFIR